MKASKPVRGHVVARLNPVAGAVAVAVSGVIAIPVQAQNRPIDEIVVTATRREAGVQDVPYNIAAFSGEARNPARELV